MQASLKAIVWDMSGVLTQEIDNPVAIFLARCRLSDEQWARIARQYLDEQDSWSRVERGLLTLGEFAQNLSLLIQEAGGECDIDHARTIWGNPDPFRAAVRVREELFNIIRHLRTSYTSAMCTNNIREWHPIWLAMIPVHELFDHIFISSEIGHRKPERSFWEHIERTVGARGGEILLIDDRHENIEGAQRHGWHAIHFTDVDECLRQLHHYYGLDIPAAAP